MKGNVGKGKILVTGSTGFVGKGLVSYLRQRNYPLVCTSRFPAGGTIPLGEMGPETEWGQVLRGVDTVIHLASHAHAGKKGLPEYQRVNVQGTEKLARQAVDAGVRRFIYMSSVKVSGERTNGRPFAEQDHPGPEDAYGISKWQAEQVVESTASQKMEVVIVRPPLIYGAGVKGNFLRLLQFIERGIPLPFGAIHNKRSFCALDNLVSFIHSCMNNDSAAGETFFVSDDRDLSTVELIRKIAKHMNRPARLFPCSLTLLEASAELFRKRSSLDKICSSLQVDISKAKQVLNWQPVIGVDEAIEKTVAWYRKDAAAA